MSEIPDGAIDAYMASLDDPSAPMIEQSMDASEDHLEVTPVSEPEESFTGFDPNALPPELQTVYKSMQADYTRKTQELADARKTYSAFSERGVDPMDALETAEFYDRLNSEPAYAKQFADYINMRLEQLGYSSPTQVPAQSQADSFVNSESYAEASSIPPELMSRLEQQEAILSEMMEERETMQFMDELTNQEHAIMQLNPHYTDSDMDHIYALAYANDADLMAAEAQYRAIQQSILSQYMGSKQAPAGIQPAPTGGHSELGPGFKSLDDAHKAAMERVRNSL